MVLVARELHGEGEERGEEGEEVGVGGFGRDA